MLLNSILNFQGPLDNPGLNIVAMRKSQPVEASVRRAGELEGAVLSLGKRL